jgi:hypothetical protein
VHCLVLVVSIIDCNEGVCCSAKQGECTVAETLSSEYVLHTVSRISTQCCNMYEMPSSELLYCKLFIRDTVGHT